jgi:hypothetical protein
MKVYHEDYLYGFNLASINNDKLVEFCLEVEQFLLENLPPVEPGWYGSVASAHNMSYNLLTFPNKELNKLYHAIQENVIPLLDTNTTYVIKSWLNVYRAGQNIDWHGHWAEESKVWHGFYCAQVRDSATYYKIPEVKEVITVPSEEGLLVMGKSAGDKHRSSDWQNNAMPRITLAFDIIPIESINNKLSVNHYLPFKQ